MKCRSYSIISFDSVFVSIKKTIVLFIRTDLCNRSCQKTLNFWLFAFDEYLACFILTLQCNFSPFNSTCHLVDDMQNAKSRCRDWKGSVCLYSLHRKVEKHITTSPSSFVQILFVHNYTKEKNKQTKFIYPLIIVLLFFFGPSTGTNESRKCNAIWRRRSLDEICPLLFHLSFFVKHHVFVKIIIVVGMVSQKIMGINTKSSKEPRWISEGRILSDGMKIRLLTTTRSDRILCVIFRLFTQFFVGFRSSDSIDSDRISFDRNDGLRLLETVVFNMIR